MKFSSPKPSTPPPLDDEGNNNNKVSFSDVALTFMRVRRFNKEKTTTSDSGGKHTQEPFAEPGATSERTVPVARSDVYICTGGVNTEKLLRATRQSLYVDAEATGANVLTEEEWSCKITVLKPRQHGGGTFRVHIQYSALAARAIRPDSKTPVALDRVKSVEGLMFIERRE